MPRSSRPELALATAEVHQATVRTLPGRIGDEALVEGIRAGEPWAKSELFDRFAPLVERTLRRLLGPGSEAELPDHIQEVFVRAISSLDAIRDAAALPAWMQTIATRTAYRTIRNKRLRRWLCFWQPADLPDVEVTDTPPEVVEACRRTYALLDRMPAAERVLFVLRFVEQQELRDIAQTSGLSLATVKRRLARAQTRFARAAAADPVLGSWLEKGGRWSA